MIYRFQAGNTSCGTWICMIFKSLRKCSQLLVLALKVISYTSSLFFENMKRLRTNVFCTLLDNTTILLIPPLTPGTEYAQK